MISKGSIINLEKWIQSEKLSFRCMIMYSMGICGFRQEKIKCTKAPWLHINDINDEIEIKWLPE